MLNCFEMLGCIQLFSTYQWTIPGELGAWNADALARCVTLGRRYFHDLPKCYYRYNSLV